MGQQSAIGQPLEVPIFVQSLAKCLTFVRTSSPPLAIDECILTALDNSINPDSPSALIAEYAYDWRNHDAEPNDADILLQNNMKLALERHSKQWDDKLVLPIPVIPELDSGEGSWDCPKCAGYRDLTSEIIAEMQNLLQITKQLRQWRKIVGRQMSGGPKCYLLFTTLSSTRS